MILGAKSEFLDLKNYELATKLERQNGAKCREITQKRTKQARVKLKNTPKTLLLMPFSR